MAVQAWGIGVLLSLVACALGSFGINLQKYAHVSQQQQQRRRRQRPPRVHQQHEHDDFWYAWLAGFMIVILGAVLDLVSFAFAPVSLLAPLGAMTLLLNILVAPCIVRETPSKRDVLVTFIIFGGAVLTIVFGGKDEPSYTLQTLIDLYTQKTVVAFFV